MNGDGLRLIALSGRASFDLNGDVLAEKLAWTAPGSDDAWLAFDRDGDGIIDRNDAVFPSLRLWQDVNHNGVSEAGELHTLQELGIASLELRNRLSKRTGEHGNQFQYRAKVKDVHGGQAGRWAWDVFLIPEPR